MAKTSHIYNELLKLLGQSKSWADIRHLHTLIWMAILVPRGFANAMICSGCVNLIRWTIYVDSRAKFAQSHQRRFSRWLHNPRINIQRLYSPIIQAALSNWGTSEIVLIEDTTMLWNRYCLIRVSVRYRGRAVPVGWCVIKHKSSSVSFDVYEQLLLRISRLLPRNAKVRFMADRGFADTKLMDYVKQNLRWHYRIRVKK